MLIKRKGNIKPRYAGVYRRVYDGIPEPSSWGIKPGDTNPKTGVIYGDEPTDNPTAKLYDSMREYQRNKNQQAVYISIALVLVLWFILGVIYPG